MKVFINYANSTFYKAQEYAAKMAYLKGGFDKVIQYRPKDIPEKYIRQCGEFFDENDSRMQQYGLWRPYIIMDALEAIKDGDYLVYCDSGIYFFKSVDLLIDIMNQSEQDIMCFTTPFIEKNWTRRDVFRALNCDTPPYTDTLQVLSGIMIIKKTQGSVLFYQEYKDIAIHNADLFVDGDNKLGYSNYDGFQEHRRNQSVFSVLIKKHGIEPFRDPSQFGLMNITTKKGMCNYKLNKKLIQLSKSNRDYPMVVMIHRKNSVNLFAKLILYTDYLLPGVNKVIIFLVKFFWIIIDAIKPIVRWIKRRNNE